MLKPFGSLELHLLDETSVALACFPSDVFKVSFVSSFSRYVVVVIGESERAVCTNSFLARSACTKRVIWNALRAQFISGIKF